MDGVSFYDLHKICRICLKTDLLVSIYSPTFLIRPVEMLTKLHIFKLPLEGLDLPTAICQACLYRLLDAYNLQQLAEASEQRLREYLGFTSLPVGNDMNSLTTTTTPLITNFTNTALSMDIIEKQTIELVDSTVAPASDSMYDNICEMILDRNEVVEVVGGTDDIDLLNDVEIDVSSLTRSDVDGDTDTFVDAVEAFEMNQSQPNNNELIHLKTASEQNNSIFGHQLNSPATAHCQSLSNTSKILKNTLDKNASSIVKTQRSPDQCGECGKIFHYRGYLSAHKRIHSGEKPFKCQICPRQFAQSSKLRLHQRTHERASTLALTLSTINNTQQQNQQVSNYCVDLSELPIAGNDTINDSIKSLSSHLNSVNNPSTTFHRGSTRHQCGVCAAFFSTSSNLKAHASTHLKQRDFQCAVCERSFKSRRDLKRHEPIHKTVKDIICPICSKAFNKRTYLNGHMLTVHRGIRRHKCNECNKVFGNRSNLICHLRTHTGEKPFQCLFCPWKFNQSSGLARHLKKHSKNLNQSLNTNNNDNHSFHNNGCSEELTGDIFDTMQQGMMENNHHQDRTDFDSFEAVNTLVTDDYHPHATTHSAQHASTKSFI